MSKKSVEDLLFSSRFRAMTMAALDASWGDGVGRLFMKELSSRTRPGRVRRVAHALLNTVLAVMMFVAAVIVATFTSFDRPFWPVSALIVALVSGACFITCAFSMEEDMSAPPKARDRDPNRRRANGRLYYDLRRSVWLKKMVDAYYRGVLPVVVSNYQGPLLEGELPVAFSAGASFKANHYLFLWMTDALACVNHVGGPDMLSPYEREVFTTFLASQPGYTLPLASQVLVDVLSPILVSDPGRVPVRRLWAVPSLFELALSSLHDAQAESVFRSLVDNEVAVDGTFADVRELVELTLAV